MPNDRFLSRESLSAVVALLRVASQLRNGLDGALAPLGITFARYEVLALLMFSRSGELPMHKISEQLDVHPTSVTSTVSRLAADGLVQRNSDPSDGRGSLISLTDGGMILVSSASEALESYLSTIGLTDAERRQIISIYRRVS
ncbi:MarR family winged helix-turn-helix transcriptional regulator [Corynebacterium lubricantis]|uniref:MarR family winged helix-turn-helix transcriptional regulator n=1 Tax=Corynebacterium lubricantis TaxID=541095 RepID=UPI000373F1F3|nr:MarR family transcriptional regulator [Corynebacterium lubricantis]